MNIKDLDISNLSLKALMTEYDITEQEIEYAGTKGSAELLGWRIIFFKRWEDLSKTVAVWFFDITGNDIEETANILLERLGIELRFGGEINVSEVFGEPDFVDEAIEKTVRYGYVLSSDKFISIGLTNGKLSFLEIVNDEPIIQEIISVRSL